MVNERKFLGIVQRKNSWNDIYNLKNFIWGLQQSKAAELALNYIKGNLKLIDLGCGYGRDIIFFRKRQKNMIIDGIDSSKRAVELYHNNLNHQIRINIRFTDILKLDKTIKEDYDIVFSNYLFNLFTYVECRFIFQKIKKLLPYDGLLISSFVSIKDRHYGKGKKLNENLYEIFKGIPCLFFEKKMIEELVSEVDFKIIDILHYSETEFVLGKPNQVEAYLLVAKK
ncbi:MAG: methyltransferase domain-containing protein [Mariniphaga sp.]|nr:methyltransferase domain-containing protein [Mariniphaga sp.]